MPRYTPTYDDWESKHDEPEKEDKESEEDSESDDPQDTDTYSNPIDEEPEHKDEQP